MSEMTDKELIGYARTHSRTERALFHGSHINRLAALAGWNGSADDGWYSCHADYMDPLCDAAAAALGSTQPTPIQPQE